MTPPCSRRSDRSILKRFRKRAAETPAFGVFLKQPLHCVVCVCALAVPFWFIHTALSQTVVEAKASSRPRSVVRFPLSNLAHHPI